MSKINAFELFGTISINGDKANSALDEISGKGKALASSLGHGFAVAGKAVVAGVAAAATAVGTLTVASVKSYAEYEQLVGGVETLFKESGKVVMDYANNAYKSAGLSANEYMSTVTSFSASLLQGLGGDTAAAADIAHVAITDMADNANKMGTSMELIQNAYQGFAKQNYTMLDNLKLGYGGTQAEMARLINDSGVLGEAFIATAENLKEIPFDKQIEAIHAIQKEMGITGTTALEASETISGSFASMKAAWDNLLVSIAGGGGMEAVLDQFVLSFDTFLGNLTKLLPSLVSGITKLVKGVIPRIPGILQSLLPGLITGAAALLTGLATALPDLMGVITEQVPLLIDQLGAAFEEAFPVLLDTIAGLIEQVDWQALGAGIVELIGQIPNLMSQLGQAISYGWENIVWPIIQGAFKAVFGVELPDWNTVVSDISDGWSNSVWPIIQDIFKAAFGVDLPDWGVILANISAGWTDGIWPGIQSFFKTNFGVELPSWESVKQSISDLWTKVKKGISGYFQAVFSVFTPDEDGTSVAVELAEWWGNVLSALGDTISAVFSIFTEDEDGRTVGERLKEWWDKVLSALGTYISAVFSVFTPDEDGTSVADEIKEWWLKVLGSLGDFISSVFDVKLPSPQDIINKIKSWWDGIKGSLSLSVSASVSTSASGSSSWSGGRTSTYTSGGGGVNDKPTVSLNAVGAVFSKPTLFDSRLGYQVVGEAGMEAVMPVTVMKGYVAEAVASQTAGLASAMERVVDAIDNMNDNMGSNLRGALDGVSVGVNKREFGRLVKAVT